MRVISLPSCTCSSVYLLIIIILSSSSLPLLPLSEQAFRLQLLAQEQELSELRTTAARLRSHKSGRDQAVKELGRIKGIISTQDERVSAREVASSSCFRCRFSARFLLCEYVLFVKGKLHYYTISHYPFLPPPSLSLSSPSPPLPPSLSFPLPPSPPSPPSPPPPPLPPDCSAECRAGAGAGCITASG